MATNSKGHVFAFNTQRRDAAAFVKEFGVGSYRRESAVQLSPAD